MAVIAVLVYSAGGRIKKLKGFFAPSSLTLCLFHMWLLLPYIDWQEWLRYMIIIISTWVFDQSRLHGTCVMHGQKLGPASALNLDQYCCMHGVNVFPDWLATKLTFVSYISASMDSQIPNHACTVGCYSFLIFKFVDLLAMYQKVREWIEYLIVTMDKRKVSFCPAYRNRVIYYCGQTCITLTLQVGYVNMQLIEMSHFMNMIEHSLFALSLRVNSIENNLLPNSYFWDYTGQVAWLCNEMHDSVCMFPSYQVAACN